MTVPPQTCRGLGLAMLVLVSALEHAFPQVPSPGDRIRVIPQAESAPPLIGRFERVSPDSVWLVPTGQGAVAVRLSPGVRVERSMGRRSHTLTGALIGAGVGAGITLWFLSGFCDDPDTLCDGDEELRAAAIFGLPSILAGAGVGALVKTERWAPVVLPGSGADAGLRLGVSLAW